MDVLDRLRKQPRALILIEATLLVLIIGAIDFKTGYEVSVYVFYSIPILLVVWLIGRNEGLWISVFSAVVWSVADVVGRSYQFDLERAWNITIQLCFFVFIVIGGAALKGQRDESRTRAALLERFHTLAQISPVGIFRIGLEGNLIYVNERWRRIAGLTSKDALPQHWTEALHFDDQQGVAAEWSRAVSEQTQCDFEARFRHARGQTVWALGRLAPEPDGHGGVAAYVGAITDMTELRRLEREILEISEREHQRIGQDLHDDLCQQLVAIQYTAAAFKRDLLQAESRIADASAEIVELLKDAVVRTRQMARSIFPVRLDQAGLMSALQEMAEKSSRLFGIECRLNCMTPVLLEDLTTGTHLFRIAQEALSNAVRHGHATEVSIVLESEPHQLTLTIQDDGIGLPTVPVDCDGMGIHIMHYRSRMIGATLQIEGLPQGGVAVRCALPQCGKHLRELVETTMPESNVRGS